MSVQDYPESHWPQQSYNLSQEKSGQPVSEVQGDRLAQHDMHMHSARLCEQSGFGASSESCPVRCGNHG